ncbi:MAG: S46 family peptidase, partial [Lysobacteraceae bacterium]
PTISRPFKALAALVAAEGRKNPDIAIKYASIVRGWENTHKNLDSQLEGFERIDAAAISRKREEDVLNWLRKQRGRTGDAPLQAHQALVALHSQETTTRERDLVLGQLGRNGVLSAAITLYRAAIEREKPDLERELGYQQRDYANIEGGIAQMERIYHPTMDRELMRYWFAEYLRLPNEQRLQALDKWLGGRDDKAIARALKSIAATKLGDTEERLRWLKATRRDFERSKDPAIRYAVAMMPTLLQIEDARKMRAGEMMMVRPTYLQAVSEFKKTKREAIYPDANGSLRITFGNVTGYSTGNGVRHAPFTLLEEVASKATGTAPFDAPQAQIDAIRAKRYGEYVDRKLGTVPVNFLSDLDISGGNSGSPVLDAQGRLTGLAFDGNKESVSSNWVFDPAVTRMISVDQRYMRWIMDEVFPAPHLLEEMGVPPKK